VAEVRISPVVGGRVDLGGGRTKARRHRVSNATGSRDGKPRRVLTPAGEKVAKSIFLSSLALRGRRCFSPAYIFMTRGEGRGEAGGSYERHPVPSPLLSRSPPAFILSSLDLCLHMTARRGVDRRARARAIPLPPSRFMYASPHQGRIFGTTIKSTVYEGAVLKKLARVAGDIVIARVSRMAVNARDGTASVIWHSRNYIPA